MNRSRFEVDVVSGDVAEISQTTYVSPEGNILMVDSGDTEPPGYVLYIPPTTTE